MDLDNLPVLFSLPLLGNKECATKGRGEERSVREPDYCLLEGLAQDLLRHVFS